ncbi:MAG: PH domain-containing protein [Patescibacteria group bacterium]
MMKEYTFNGQREGEKVEEVVYQHPYVLYAKGMKAILLIVVGVGVFLFLPKLYLLSILAFFVAAILLAATFFCFRETMFIITNRRVFLIEQSSFFNRRIAEVNLENIIDMFSETGGLSKTLLKYGDLHIRSAGSKEGGDIILRDIPAPYIIQQRVAAITEKKTSSKSQNYLSQSNS